jgi:hypothetical protein
VQASIEYKPSLSLWQNYLADENVKANRGSYQRFHALYLKHHNLIKADQARLQQDITSLKTTVSTPDNQLSSALKWFVYRILCLAGAIYAVCSGFDGMITVLEILCPHLYIGLMVTFGVVSALSGLGIFIARDKPSIAQELAIKESSKCSDLDEYLFLLQQYLHLKKTMMLKLVQNSDQGGDSKLKEDIITFLNQQHEFEKLQAIYQDVISIQEQRVNSWEVFLESQLVLLIAAVLFFSDGFFVGEAIGNFLSSFLHINPVFFTFGMALLLACCALASYCFVERPTLKEYLEGTLFTKQSIFQTKGKELSADLDFIRFASFTHKAL